jgi:hypothetical protein
MSRILISIEEELWDAILSEAGGDDGIESLFEDWDERVKIIEPEENKSNDLPVKCEGCGLTIPPGDGVEAECGAGWFHCEAIGEDYDPCIDIHHQNCSLCPIDL